MSIESTLTDMGAECVCGDLILNQKTVGRYRDGSFYLTEDGIAIVTAAAEAALGAVEVVEAATPKAGSKPRAPKAAPKPAVEIVQEVAPADAPAAPAPDALSGLDDLLGDAG